MIFRPVALASCNKNGKIIIKQFILISLGRKLDLFAYRVVRGIDAKLFILNAFYKHMEKPKAHARLLFADFSSLLNTVNHTL